MTTTTTDTNLTQLVIHELTKAEYEALTPVDNQLYLTPDESLTADDLKTINGNSIVGSGNIVIDSLPNQSGSSGKFLTTDGSSASWASISIPTVDQTYDGTSSNAQSGVAIAGAGFVANTATGTNSLTIDGTATSSTSAVNIGKTSTSGGGYSVALGYYAASNGARSTSIGYGARIGGSTPDAIQIGNGTNSNSKTLSVGFYNTGNYELLDGTTGLIPDARISSNIARASAIPTVNNATLTITQGGNTKGTFTANSATNTTISIDSSPRQIGEIVTSTVPLSDAGLHLLDGSYLEGDGIYSDFVNYMDTLYKSGNYDHIFERYEAWVIELSNYGVCGKFYITPKGNYYAWTNSSLNITLYTTSSTPSVGDELYGVDLSNHLKGTSYTLDGVAGSSITVSGNSDFLRDSANDISSYKGTVRLPKITGFTEGTITLTELGDLTEAGLPSIEHTHVTTLKRRQAYGSGNVWAYDSAGNTDNDFTSTTNSAVSDIYGNSNTVQPQSIKVLYYIVVAATTKTDIEVDIDEIATDLNGKVDKSSLSQIYPVVETYVNGNDWYRIWAPDSTGYRWCEQGTLYYKGSTLANTDNEITFLKPFKDVNYTFIPTPIHGTANVTVYQIYEKYSSRTTSTTVLRIPGAIFGYAWVARGYIVDEVL